MKQFSVSPTYVVKVREPGWVDAQMENKLENVYGPIWNEKEATIALIKQKTLNPGVKLELKTLTMKCEEV